MKTSWRTVVLGVVTAFGLVGFNAKANLEISATVQVHARTDFEAPLGAHGAWIEAGSYGHCWRPAHVAVEWRPYCDGEWVWTDAGWYWQSDEPWAWACYHYGSWVYDTSYGGWIWIPDIDWAPAWVEWRYGGGYVGWAPCAPRRVGFFASFSTPAPPFVFVAEGHFHERVRPGVVIINDRNILRKTSAIHEMRQENRNLEGIGSRRVNFNEGPPVAKLRVATANQVRTVNIREEVDRTPAPRGNFSPAPKNSEPARPGREIEHAPAPAPAPVFHENPVTPPPEHKVVPVPHENPATPPVEHHVVPQPAPVPHEKPAAPPSEHRVIPAPVRPPVQEQPRERHEEERPHEKGHDQL